LNPAQLHHLLPAAMLGAAALAAGLAFRLRSRIAWGALAPILLGQRHRWAPLLTALLSIAVWLACHALDLLIADDAASFWLHRLSFLGVASLGPALVWIAAEASGREWLKPPLRAALILVPAVTIGLALSSGEQHVLWREQGQRAWGPLSSVSYAWGPWLWVHVIFSSACIALALGVLARLYVSLWPRYGQEAVCVLLAIVGPWSANVAGFALGVEWTVDVSALGLVGGSGLLALALRPDPLESLLARAQQTLLDALGDAIFLLDSQRRVVYANRGALELLGKAAPEEPWQPGRALVHYWPKLAAQIRDHSHSRGEVTLEHSGATWFYELHLSDAPSTDRVRGARLAVLRDVTERRRAERAVRQLAFYDGLTGLANRHLFARQLAQALESARQSDHVLALLYLDLDHFKTVNDSLGHAAGDELLRAVSERLRYVVRASDVVGRLGRGHAQGGLARLGGDEFAILLPTVPSPDACGEVAQRILAQLAEPFEAAGRRLAGGVSIGVAFFPQDAQDAETLMKNADTALYHAKERGRNQFQFFRPTLNSAAQRRLEVERELQVAIAEQQFRLVFQPRVDLATGAPATLEALIRWKSPVLGTVPPSHFIPIAEKTGQIVAIGNWVLEEALRSMRAWLDQGLRVPGVAVNLASAQLDSPRFFDTVTHLLKRERLEPTQLELEITEGTLLHQDEATLRPLRELRSIGVRLSLDDFGTGYSSLSYLQQLSPDALKLDRSFVSDLDSNRTSAGIVAAVISMTRSLGIRSVAEGVERLEELEALRQLGCEEVQGFLYCVPLEADEVPAFLRQAPRWDEPAKGSRSD
jgi:diguanylate cyclase (GGDEF)-like protein/PAS domain S-box-containing protein